MSILVDKNSRVVVQGATGRDGSFHAAKMFAYGTKVVAGVSPGKGGSTIQNGIPIFNGVEEAVKNEGANTSIIFVPAPFVKDAILEAADAGISLVICITEGVPLFDTLYVTTQLKRAGVKLIGPNSPGIISPGKSLIGIMPGNIFKEGSVGVISRSGTLTYEIVHNLTQNGIGQSTAVGIGGDPIVGLHYIELLEKFEQDPDTSAIVLVGEIGGDAEEEAARYIKEHVTKPVVAYIAGSTAPADKQMGHAGAIITGSSGRAEDKKRALMEVGVAIADEPSKIAALLKK